MRMKSRKGLSILLVFVLVLAMSATSAFAAWPSFQNENDNNGVTDVLVTTPATDYVDFPVSFGGGITAPSLIDDGIAYTLYNGGYNYDPDGGAHLVATDLDNSTSEKWNTLLDATADNIAQLSTPVLVDTDLYVLTTGVTSLYNPSPFNTTDWLTDDADIDNGEHTATFPADNETYIYSNTAEVHFIANTTNITTEFALESVALNNDAKYTIGLYNSNDVPVATLVSNAILYGGNPTALNYYAGPAIPAGNYKIKLTIETDETNDITVTSISLSGNGWNLYKIPTATGCATLLESGVGAANTPITHSGDYIYFGIYGGDQSYYQYNISTPALNRFEAEDDFYWAGATVATINSTDYVVFGSEDAKLYLTPVDFFGAVYTVVDLTNDNYVSLKGIATAGAVRSTIVKVGSYLYFTSQGTGDSGYLWKAETSTLLSAPVVDWVGLPHFTTVNDTLSTNTTSTPVVSDNGYVYVGYGGDYTDLQTPSNSGKVGGVVGVPVASFSTGSRFQVYGTIVTENVTGDPVQSSPIVYSDEDLDYIYFTTNSSSGTGYCYSYDTFSPTVTPEWTAGGTNYTLQGFAADGGYLVYGDDGCRLYIIEE